MQITDFDFDLPEELIAQQPLKNRTASRLLCLSGTTGQLQDKHFADLLDLLRDDDLLVFNNTKVIPARLYGQKATGGQVEILLERIEHDHQALALIGASKSPKPGSFIRVGDTDLEVLGREGQFFRLACREMSFMALLDNHGHIPLPPYISRQDNADDLERYQTVYAEQQGAVAAPTAGLHFDEAILARLAKLGIEQAFVTLHVGAGTFQPVRDEQLHAKRLHKERLILSKEAADKINRAKACGRRIIAVGTTSVRVLESMAQGGRVEAGLGETELFITPGFNFQIVDALITNFHLPKSSLLMLVSALAGKEAIFSAYQHAVNQAYRFFSYGDAMFITGKHHVDEI